VTVWDWIDEYVMRAEASGDGEHLRLSLILDQAEPLRQKSPDAALALYDQGARLAERLNEPWWVMLFRHWRLQTLIFITHNCAAAVELAARCALEARKPTYARLPQRICLHEDLITAYVATDPLGYAAMIEDALAYMAKEVQPDLECYLCLQELRTDFEIATGQLDRALACGLQFLERAGASTHEHNRAHHTALSYAQLCRIAFARGEWTALLDWARAGEEVADPTSIPQTLVETLAWQAVALRHRGEDGPARRAFLRAAAGADRLAGVPCRSYFDAVSAYHELGGELDAAYRTRGRELAGLTGRGRVSDECHCHLERCRLLKLMEQSLDDELAATREAASKLKDPEPILSNLDRLISDTIPAQ
jgi:hypothetical protein